MHTLVFIVVAAQGANASADVSVPTTGRAQVGASVPAPTVPASSEAWVGRCATALHRSALSRAARGFRKSAYLVRWSWKVDPGSVELTWESLRSEHEYQIKVASTPGIPDSPWHVSSDEEDITRGMHVTRGMHETRLNRVAGNRQAAIVSLTDLVNNRGFDSFIDVFRPAANSCLAR